MGEGMSGGRIRVTYTLPRDLIEEVDQLAKRMELRGSDIVSAALRQFFSPDREEGPKL